MLDDRTAADRVRDAEDHFVWNNRSNLVGWSSYLGRSRVGAPALPDYAAPARRGDLSGLPRTWLYASDVELFHDEVVSYADRLAAADVDVTLDVVTGAAHGFEAWAPQTPVAQELLARARDWLSSVLAN